MKDVITVSFNCSNCLILQVYTKYTFNQKSSLYKYLTRTLLKNVLLIVFIFPDFFLAGERNTSFCAIQGWASTHMYRQTHYVAYRYN